MTGPARGHSRVGTTAVRWAHTSPRRPAATRGNAGRSLRVDSFVRPYRDTVAATLSPSGARTRDDTRPRPELAGPQLPARHLQHLGSAAHSLRRVRPAHRLLPAR
ncbi:hypothetical protein SGPA1_60233 [Streptomyces misionensis JCM 4497]